MRWPRQLRPVGDYVPRVPLRTLAAVLFGREFPADVAYPDFPGYYSDWYGSGTQALAAALLKARTLRPVSRPEVILPAYACPDLASAVEFAGMRGVLVDTLPNLPWLDPDKVAQSITPHTVAVISVRFLGLAGNDKAIRAAIGDGGPAFIEDWAHVLVTDFKIASCADFVVMSFGRGKPVSLRHGGVLLRSSQSRFAACESKKSVRMKASRTQALQQWLDSACYNFSIQPFVYWLLVNGVRIGVDRIDFRSLRKLEPFAYHLLPTLMREFQRLSAVQATAAAEIRATLQQVAGPWEDLVRCVEKRTAQQDCSSHASHAPWRYPLLLPTQAIRDRLFGDLRRAGLGVSKMYDALLTDIPGATQPVQGGSIAAARDFAGRLLTLPTHSDMTAADCAGLRVCLDRFAANNGPWDSIPLPMAG